MVSDNRENNSSIAKDSITLSYKQIGAIVLVIINLIVIGPGSWFLTTLWTEATNFKNDTEREFKDLKDEIGSLRVELSSGYVTRQSFSDYREQMAENIRHMDSKVAGIKD